MKVIALILYLTSWLIIAELSWTSYNITENATEIGPSAVLNGILYALNQDGVYQKTYSASKWSHIDNQSSFNGIYGNEAFVINNQYIYRLSGNPVTYYSFDIFDTITQQLATKPDGAFWPLDYRYQASCAASDGMNALYFISGYISADGYAEDIVVVYDITSETWRNVTGMKYPTVYAGCVYHDNIVYNIGGLSGIRSSNKYSIIQLYDTQIDEWMTEEIESSLGGFLLDTNPIVGPDGYIYIIGGRDGSYYSGNVLKFDPENKVVTSETSINNVCKYCMNMIINARIITCNDYNSDGYIQCEQSNVLLSADISTTSVDTDPSNTDVKSHAILTSKLSNMCIYLLLCIVSHFI